MYGSRQYPSHQKRTVSRCCVNLTLLINLFYHSHPLVEQLADIFVPNDACLVGGRGQALGEEERSRPASQATSEAGDSQHISEDGVYSIAICTGANACGKASEYDLTMCMSF
jgi:hypothetical protein